MADPLLAWPIKSFNWSSGRSRLLAPPMDAPTLSTEGQVIEIEVVKNCPGITLRFTKIGIQMLQFQSGQDSNTKSRHVEIPMQFCFGVNLVPLMARLLDDDGRRCNLGACTLLCNSTVIG
jgi:hypothetical protein